MPNKNIQNALKPIMHRTYDSYDGIIKDIEKSIKHTSMAWEIRGDTIRILIDNKYGLLIKPKAHYNTDTILVQENEGE